MPAAPFANEHELEKVIQRCHNILWERHGLDPAQAFDEFSKLLFVRLYDEATFCGARTTVRPRESAADFAGSIRRLFREANAKPGFEGIFSHESIQADDVAILEVFRQLQDYSLLETTAAVKGADVKGTIYENMLGNTFRGELGQFFTHRSIVEFMVRLVGIDENKVVYDPSCGSGGFLIMCAKVLREQLLAQQPAPSSDQLAASLRDYSRRCLIGTEINERTARVAKLNLLMHGLDYSNIFTVNALKADETADERLRAAVGEARLDLVFANPPFAGYEKDPRVLGKFTLGTNGGGTPASVTREVLFIERIIRVLRDGGLAGIVIPQGIFTNRNLGRVRDFIRAHAQILAIIELPDWAFIPSGTSVRGSLLFLRKMANPPGHYHVFMKRVENIGFSSTGRPTDRNDFPITIEQYRSQDSRYLVPIGQLQGRIDAKFHAHENQAVLKLFEHNPAHKLVPLADIGSFYTTKVNPRLTPDSDIALIETSSVDPATLTITPRRVKGRACNYTCLRRVRAGDILISRRRAYRGAVAVVPAELDGALAIPELSILRLNKNYAPDYIAEILRSPYFVQLMTIYSTGEMSGRIAEKDLVQLRIPIPRNHRRLGARFRKLRQTIADLEQRAAHHRKQIADSCSAIVEGSMPS